MNAPFNQRNRDFRKVTEPELKEYVELVAEFFQEHGRNPDQADTNILVMRAKGRVVAESLDWSRGAR